MKRKSIETIQDIELEETAALYHQVVKDKNSEGLCSVKDD